ncbi:ABC-type dipeptide/oligopeptide/nickel transport system, ATPase component [Devosia sp. YR412]|uniref:ABC transporter ATP-binding protein n=1 Tax=Devosia sp. YR412 TaxID=1881030 RepID=UPI0008D4C3A9|nr:ABC transporter ATP-binding protein [Devosia sp. YR412]SEP63727.1 ABC-type dipeptide/oligopeptide/nickel transport system, ATPase component [Devosia sp. YR412]
MHDQTAPLLTAENLRVQFNTLAGPIQAVRGVSFTVGREKVGVIGESGSGKSMTGRAIMRLLGPSASILADRLQFEDVDLLRASEKQMQTVRGRRIGMILQDPKYSLNPVMSVGDQITEMARLHLRESKSAALERALSMLEQVRIRDPKRVYALYPHEVSGGMGQRIMIAMMLVASPTLIIADEPTSALDVSVRAQILDLLDELIVSRGIGLMFISHDLNMVRRFCDRALIMYSGQIVETIKAADLDSATHPYTQGLLHALPRMDAPRDMLDVLKRDPAWLERRP